ncbi:jerky protein homolog-like [Rhizophagus clarus]|uniref:Jerky protein homolog-like n=1 Tax=Rhizophagus clarus TaxID=94130 RepID=A0A8H3KW69_9GLOM|nr:jerky protein homolog-like [Rhizophagus clarus]
MELSRVLAHDSIFGHKKEKFQITIFYAVNIIGTEKMALSFIHKHKTPHIMKNLNYKNLPVYYFWNKKSWMQVNETQEKLDSITRLIIQNRIDAYNNVQDNIIEKLADYNIFEVLQNSAEACNEIEDDLIFDDYVNIEDEEAELKKLITFLPEEGALTNDKIIDSVLNSDKEEEIVMDENESMPVMEKISLKEAKKAVNNIT